MKEDFLQYIWENSLFKSDNLISSEGESIIIHDIGVRNKNSGPDFLNVEIIINEIKWFGNVKFILNLLYGMLILTLMTLLIIM